MKTKILSIQRREGSQGVTVLGSLYSDLEGSDIIEDSCSMPMASLAFAELANKSASKYQ